MSEKSSFQTTIVGLLAASIAANAWLVWRLNQPAKPAGDISNPPPPAKATASPPATKPNLTLVSWDYKMTMMKWNGGDVAGRFIEGLARNDSGVDAGPTEIFFSVHDKTGAKVDDRSASVRRLGTNEVWKFTTEPFKYPFTAKFVRFSP